MIRILTDTGSDITYLGASDAGVEILELDVKFDEFPYDYRNDADFSVFYENLKKAKGLPSTSQATPAQYLDVFEDVKAKGDEMIVITLSGGLSGTHASAQMALAECEYDGISVIDSRQAIGSQRFLAEHAVALRDEGKSRAEIVESVMDLRDRSKLIACLDTLTYLKKGGRVPPAMALIGNAIKIKPVIHLVDGKIEPLDKVRGVQAGLRAIQQQLDENPIDNDWPVYIGHANDEERGKMFMEETKEKYGIKNCSLIPVGCVIGTHTGPSAIFITYVTKK